jgi:hypothetical protein
MQGVKRHQITAGNPTGTETSLTLSKIPTGGGGPVAGPGVNNYYPLNGGSNGSTTGNLFSANMPIAGVIQNLVFSSDVPPGVGAQIQATLYKNGVATLLQATISGNSSTFATDGTNVITFTATDLLVLQVTNSLLSAVTRFNQGMLILIP